MENIFKNAKFGDKFIDIYNVIWLYISYWNHHNTKNGMYNLIPDKNYNVNSECVIDQFNPDGTRGFNTSYYLKKYKEPINEDKLDKLAYKNYVDCLCAEDGFIKGFKEGYRKAREE